MVGVVGRREPDEPGVATVRLVAGEGAGLARRVDAGQERVAVAVEEGAAGRPVATTVRCIIAPTARAVRAGITSRKTSGSAW